MTGVRLAMVVLGACAVSVRAQDPQQPVFRTGVETVAIYATVVDANGAVVKRLQRSDFLVYDNGWLQDLTTFEPGVQPITATVLIDTSQSMTLSLDLARFAAEQFIVRLQPGDKARVGEFNELIQMSPEFTENRDALLRWLHQERHTGNPTRLWDAIDHTRAELAPVGGRRILMVMTDGEDTYSKEKAFDVFTRARGDELMIYLIQFRRAGAAFTEKVPPEGLKNFFQFGGQVVDGARGGEATPGQVLERFAWQTGGAYRFIRPNDNVNAIFTGLIEELHYQYVIGFTPKTFDGKLHVLDTKVRTPGLTVRARRSYLAPQKAGG
jgi:Ca-activated chloride channel family protein